jgi:primosomal protein N'
MIAKIVPAVRLPVKASETYDYQIPANLTPAIGRGSVVVIPFAGRKIGGLVVSISETTAHNKPLKDIVGVAQGLSPLPSYVVELWTRLSRLFATTLPRFVWAALPTVPSRAIVPTNPPYPPLPQGRGNIQSPLFEKEGSDVRSDPDFQIIDAIKTSGVGGVPASFFFINSSLDALKFVKNAIAAANGRQALILVPTVDEAAAWAKTIDNAMVYHSSLAIGAKYDLVCAARNGTAKIVIGTKIAAFLPFSDLSQIVIVNAGSSSHLQEDQDPRYDARVIAEELSRATGAALTAIDPFPPLGFTPNSAVGHWQFANQPKRFEPIIHDLHDAAKAAKARVLISDGLETAIDETVGNGGRCLVILNRRGVSTAILCRDCGTIVACPSCGIPLTVHQDRMSCPSCDRLYPLFDACPKCNGLDLKAIGSGSKTLFEALKKRHPLAIVAHVDRDSWQTDLDAAQIVVGTTAVFGSMPPEHKQFDLVADALMGAGQMRSGIWSTENSARVLRTLASFLTLTGKLHIQTFDRSAPALAALTDPMGFLAKELEERAAFGYPPAGTLITIYAAGIDEAVLWKHSLDIIEIIKSHLPLAISHVPTWSRPKKFRGKFRLTIIVKLPHGQDPHDLVQYLPTGFSAEVRMI